MKNTTSIKIANKYMDQLELVERDGDGYWAYSNPGFMFEEMGCHTAHEDTQKELQAVIRTLVPCDCQQCQQDLAEEATPEVAEYEKIPVVEKTQLKNGKFQIAVHIGGSTFNRTSNHDYQAFSIVVMKDDKNPNGWCYYAATFSNSVDNATKAANKYRNEIIKYCEPGSFISTIIVEL